MIPSKNRGSSFVAIFFLEIAGFSILFWAPSLLDGNENPSAKKVLFVAAASNLRFVMNEIAIEFEKENGVAVKVSYGSSGSISAQIKAGAPYDLFFSADESIPRKLVKEGFAERDSFFLYGIGRIVLWVANQSVIDLETEGMDGLVHTSVHKIAIANPRHAPYGSAAISALKNLSIFKKVEKKIILGENVSHVAQFVQSGGAEIGILSYSLAISAPLKESGRYWKIPPENYPEIVQAAVILLESQNSVLSRSFMDFIKKGRGKNILLQYGL